MKQLIQFNNTYYVLLRIINKSMFENTNKVKDYMTFINAEHVLQNNDHYMFVNNVDTVEFEEEIF